MFSGPRVRQKLKLDREKNHINVLVGVVCISNFIAHWRTKSVLGVEKSAVVSLEFVWITPRG